MTPEQQLIQQICQLLESGHIDRNPLLEDYAEQFVELCRQANERLLRCQDYIDKGMRSEAVHEAHSAPDLLALGEMLQFEGLKKWRNLCADLELAVFQPLNDELLARLRRECEREQELMPLLKEYRRLVYQGDHQACVAVLRLIREKDPGNPSWAANLRPLEEEAMQATLAAAEEAIGKQDLPRLKTLYAELTNPQRVAVPPEDVLRRMRQLLLHDRAEELRCEGSGLVERLKSALENNDREQLDVMCAAADRLAADEAFLHLPDDWDKTIAAAKETLAVMGRRADKMAEFGQAVAALQDALSAGSMSELSLRHEWERLSAWEMPVPDMLRKQVMETLADLQSRRQRRQRRWRAVLTLLLLLLLGAAATFVHYRMLQSRRAAIFTEMERMHASEQYQALQDYMEHIGRGDPDFVQSPPVQTLRQNMLLALRELNKAAERYQQAMNSLEAIRQGGYGGSDPVTIERHVAEAGETAFSEEEKNRVDAWRRTWLGWRQGQQRDADNELKRLIDGYATAKQDAKRQPYTDFAREQEKIGELILASKKGELLLPLATDAVVTAFQEAREDLGAWERDLSARREADADRQQKLQALRRDIPKALPDLPRYLTLLETFCQLQPGSPETSGYQRVLEQRTQLEKVYALHGLSVAALPASEESAQVLRQALTGKAAGSVWEADLRRCLALDDDRQALLGQVNALLGLNPDMLNVTVTRYRARTQSDWQVLYSPKPLMEGKERGQDGQEYAIYFGTIYHARDASEAPLLLHTKDIFPNRLNARDYEIAIYPVPQDNFCAHAKFLFRLVAEANESPLPAVHLLRALNELVADQEMHLIPKLWLIRAIMGVLQDQCRAQLPECAEWLDLLNDVDVNTPWMNPTYPPAMAANAAIGRRLSLLPDFGLFAKRLQNNLRVLAAAINVSLRCVGSMQPTATGELQPMLVENAPNELWMMVVPSHQAPAHFMLLSISDLKLDQEAYRLCFAGMPLFAPGRDHEASTMLSRMGIGATEKGGLVRPAAWPVNAW